MSRNIFQRINDVMKAVQYVQKDKHVSGAGANYKAVTHDQVISVARSELVKAGIVIYPEQKENEMLQKRDLKLDIKMHLYSGFYDIHFVNIDDPKDRMTVSINAHAADNGDKAPGKCLSYATKSAILKALCLETGENDESREEIRDKNTFITENQYQQLADYCYINNDAGVEWTKTGTLLAKAYKIQALHLLPKSKFKEALERCEKLKGNV